MGTTRDDGSQQSMWVSAADLPRGGGHPFYERLNRILEAAGFDAFVEGLCAWFYATKANNDIHQIFQTPGQVVVFTELSNDSPRIPTGARTSPRRSAKTKRGKAYR